MTYALGFFIAFIFWACVIFGVRWWIRWRKEQDRRDRFEFLEQRGQALERLEDWTGVTFPEVRESNEQFLKETNSLEGSSPANKPS